METSVYSAKEFASLLGISKSALLKMEAEGTLPQPRLDNGMRTYHPHDIPEYLARLGKPPLVGAKRRQIFLNFKGGTGKTSISAFYAFRLAQLGMNVLMVDLDPQGHLTQCLGIDHSSFDATLYNVLIERMDIRDAIIDTKMKNLKLIPANLDLSPVELSLTSMNARELRLKKSITSVQEEFDIIIMDASPSIGLLNLNGILASNELFVPVLADFLSYHGLKILFETLTTIEEDFDFLLDNIYIFLNNFNASHNICLRAKEALEKHYSGYLMKTIIRQDTKIAEAASMGMPIHQYAPNNRGASDINAFIKEIFPNLPIAF
ncbi:MAG TPA: AAA family ATPase [Deltaproteobacteria bacterium]|nr:AAA family ATPase [Bacteriovoracaceae bacterium]HON60271.1 AAA family ATPase [Deltaproteobacteria bacterium]HRR20648.1 AAA family ATPase [Desulfomonilia bacterium]HPA84755.1 AAA family ATPase [Deltaproteobacteria bacterium]HQA72824.1 AAA family ATPase [Deltaproteobacteria bacterium]